MAVSYPVHPDDALALLKIRRYLIGHRLTNGWSRTELSRRISDTNGMAQDLETNMSWQWRMPRLQDWCAAFDLRLTARVTVGPVIDKRVHEDPMVAQLYAMSQAEGEVWKMSQRAYLTAALRTARHEKNVAPGYLAAQLGCTDSALWNWEREADRLMISKVLHYARILGGRVDLGLSGVRFDGQA